MLKHGGDGALETGAPGRIGTLLHMSHGNKRTQEEEDKKKEKDILGVLLLAYSAHAWRICISFLPLMELSWRGTKVGGQSGQGLGGWRQMRRQGQETGKEEGGGGDRRD